MPTNPISTSLVVYQTVSQHFQSTTPLDGMYTGNIKKAFFTPRKLTLKSNPILNTASESVQHTPSVELLLDCLKDHLFTFVLKSREKNALWMIFNFFCFFKENYDAFILYHLEKNGFNVTECEELNSVMYFLYM